MNAKIISIHIISLMIFASISFGGELLAPPVMKESLPNTNGLLAEINHTSADFVPQSVIDLAEKLHSNGIKFIFFDVDDTLVYNESYKNKMKSAIFQFLVKNLKIKMKQEEIVIKIAKRQKDLNKKRLKLRPTDVFGLFDIKLTSRHEKELSDMIKVSDYIKTDPRQIALFKYLHSQGFYLGVISDNLRAVTEANLKALGVFNFFKNNIVTASEGRGKPGSIETMLEHFGIEQNRSALMVGDDQVIDIEGALNLGMLAFHIKNYNQLFEPYKISFPEQLDELKCKSIKFTNRFDVGKITLKSSL
ncbi:MAG: HAD family hydrolase [bacterium]